MSGEFRFFMSGVIIMFFTLALMLLIASLMYFFDDDGCFMSAKNAVVSACLGIFVLIIDTVICYWVWG